MGLRRLPHQISLRQSPISTRTGPPQSGNRHFLVMSENSATLRKQRLGPILQTFSETCKQTEQKIVMIDVIIKFPPNVTLSKLNLSNLSQRWKVETHSSCQSNHCQVNGSYSLLSAGSFISWFALKQPSCGHRIWAIWLNWHRVLLGHCKVCPDVWQRDRERWDLGAQTHTGQMSSSDICMVKVSHVQGCLPTLNAWPFWRNDWKLIYSWTFFSYSAHLLQGRMWVAKQMKSVSLSPSLSCALVTMEERVIIWLSLRLATCNWLAIKWPV